MKIKGLIVFIDLFVLAILLASCNSKKNEQVNNPLFQLLPSSKTGIYFNNKVQDTKDFNVFKYRNFYNGGGVAIGDVNNDGKPDIFFTSNQGKNRLYINKGNWQFEDVTARQAWAAYINGIQALLWLISMAMDGWIFMFPTAVRLQVMTGRMSYI